MFLTIILTILYPFNYHSSFSEFVTTFHLLTRLEFKEDIYFQVQNFKNITHGLAN